MGNITVPQSPHTPTIQNDKMFEITLNQVCDIIVTAPYKHLTNPRRGDFTVTPSRATHHLTHRVGDIIVTAPYKHLTNPQRG
jgi:hypothetical protein